MVLSICTNHSVLRLRVIGSAPGNDPHPAKKTDDLCLLAAENPRQASPFPIPLCAKFS